MNTRPTRTSMWLVAGLFHLTFLVWPVAGMAGAASKVAEGAKSERQVVWRATIAHDQAAKLIAEFEKRNPFIKVSYWRSGSLGVYNKIVTEARAGRIGWDVVSISTVDQMVDLIRNRLVAPYQSAERSMFSDDIKDDEGYWTGEYAKPIGLGFNTKQVSRQDAPKTYRDLLDPKWKGGKISIDNEGYQLLCGLIAAWGKERAIDYLKRLAAQDPIPGRGNTQRTQLVAAGEFPLLLAYTHSIEWMKSQGAPIDWLNLEPVVIEVSTSMLAQRASHPNAGKLLVDFMLSREGQSLFKSFRRVTLRTERRTRSPAPY